MAGYIAGRDRRQSFLLLESVDDYVGEDNPVRVAGLRDKMRHLREMEEAVKTAPDGQISLTDPDARAMATNGKGTGLVGYNVQAAVDTRHHLIVAHEVTNIGHDRTQLVPMAAPVSA